MIAVVSFFIPSLYLTVGYAVNSFLMRLTIRLGSGPRVKRRGTRNQRLALAAAALLIPFSLMAFALGFWRLAADMQWAKQFAFAEGPLSHWQIWIGVGLFLQAAAALLNRYGTPSSE